MSALFVRRGGPLVGELTPPGDKSISHRSVILGAIATGQTRIRGFLAAEDCANTARAFEQMGVTIETLAPGELLVTGVGLRGIRAPSGPLDMGNSGTGLRLLMGVLAGQAFGATLAGDESLSRRPMDRVAIPLRLMGADVSGLGERCLPPVTIRGGALRPISYALPIASAQVKSAVLLAGLYADGVTTVTEPALSRDHTERMLAAFGATVQCDGLLVSVEGNPILQGQDIAVPGDISSAAFALAAALLSPGSVVTARNVLLNPTRAGLLEALARMGADIVINNRRCVGGEPVGDVTARHSLLEATQVGGEEIPRLLDEVPILAAIATQARGKTVISDAAELRVKESDRLAAMARALSAMGAQIHERPDGLVISGPTPLRGASLEGHLDHRVAMSLAVAGLIAEGETTVLGAECIDTSFPGFVGEMARLGANVQVV